MRIRHIALTVTALTMCAITGTQAYVVNGPRWGTNQVPYYINPANLDVSESAAEAAVQAGMATWGSQSNANFSFYYMGRTTGTALSNNGKNEIFFRNASAGSMAAEAHWWYDGSNHLIDADILFYDGGFKLFTGSSWCSVVLLETSPPTSRPRTGLGHSCAASATCCFDWLVSTGRELSCGRSGGVEARIRRVLPRPNGTKRRESSPDKQLSFPRAAQSRSPARRAIVKMGRSVEHRMEIQFDGSLVGGSHQGIVGRQPHVTARPPTGGCDRDGATQRHRVSDGIPPDTVSLHARGESGGTQRVTVRGGRTSPPSMFTATASRLTTATTVRRPIPHKKGGGPTRSGVRSRHVCLLRPVVVFLVRPPHRPFTQPTGSGLLKSSPDRIAP